MTIHIQFDPASWPDAAPEDDPRVDPARLNGLEAAVVAAAATFGFTIHGFAVFEDRAGRHAPKITIELEQGPAQDPALAVAWFQARGAKVTPGGGA